ncbi:MAG: hypothetical protein JWP91_314 [Fibrobacteres bacterium]|nr:hypothetical protein [Fibrobacterota bacterium]
MGMRRSRNPSLGTVLTGLLHFLARFGSFCVGTVYVLIGVWALLALNHMAEPAADEERILQRLVDFPFGGAFIVVLATGTLGYTLWRLYEAVSDPYGFGNSPKALMERAGMALSASAYGVIALAALKVLAGNGGHGEEKQQALVGKVLEWPAGAWLVGAMGLVIAFSGLYQIKYVQGGEFKKRLELKRMNAFTRTASDVLAWLGFIARCVILSVLGGFLIRAAWLSDPKAVGDTDTAFDFLGLGGSTWGDSLFTVVALGTIGYGVFMYLNGAYFHFSDGTDGGRDLKMLHHGGQGDLERLRLG